MGNGVALRLRLKRAKRGEIGAADKGAVKSGRGAGRKRRGGSGWIFRRQHRRDSTRCNPDTVTMTFREDDTATI